MLNEVKTKQFNELLEKEMKSMMTDGLYPHSPLWFLGKINAMFKIIENLRIKAVVGADDPADRKSFKIAMLLHKFFLFRNYKFIIFLNNILEFKRYFKRYLLIDGHRFWIKPKSKMMEIINDYKSLKGKVWEEETTKLVKKHVQEGMTCVDIGASVGYFTLLFARQVGKTGKVVAIEPTDFQQPYLAKNIKVNGYKGRVTQISAGAWYKDEIMKMPLNAPEHVQTIIKCRATDDILAELGITKVDFIKIDTDGPEPNVLKGLTRTIERSSNLKMVVEFYPKYIQNAGLNPKDMLDILDKYFNYSVIPGDYSQGCWNLYCERKLAV